MNWSLPEVCAAVSEIWRAEVFRSSRGQDRSFDRLANLHTWTKLRAVEVSNGRDRSAWKITRNSRTTVPVEKKQKRNLPTATSDTLDDRERLRSCQTCRSQGWNLRPKLQSRKFFMQSQLMWVTKTMHFPPAHKKLTLLCSVASVSKSLDVSLYGPLHHIKCLQIKKKNRLSNHLHDPDG